MDSIKNGHNDNSLDLIKNALNKNSKKEDIDLFKEIRDRIRNEDYLQRSTSKGKQIEYINLQESLHYKFLENQKLLNSTTDKKIKDVERDKSHISFGYYVLFGFLCLIGLFFTAYVLVMIPILILLYIYQGFFSKRNY